MSSLVGKPLVIVSDTPDPLERVVNGATSVDNLSSSELFFPFKDGEPENVISFEHFLREGEYGAKLTFVDPTGEFETKFVARAFAQRAKEMIATAAPDSTTASIDTEYEFDKWLTNFIRNLISTFIGAIVGAFGGSEVVTLFVAYGIGDPNAGGSWTGPFRFVVGGANVAYPNGAKEITLDLVPAPLHKFSREGLARSTAVGRPFLCRGTSDTVDLKERVPSELHPPVRKALRNLIRAGTRYNNVLLLLPDMDKVLAPMVEEQKAIYERAGKNVKTDKLAPIILEKVLEDINMSLGKVEDFSKVTIGMLGGPIGSYRDFKKEFANPTVAYAGSPYSEMLHFIYAMTKGEPHNASRRAINKLHQVYASIADLAARFKKVDLDYYWETDIEMCEKIAGAAGGAQPIDGSKAVFVIGDSGMISHMKGNGTATLWNGEDSGLQNLGQPPETQSVFKYNMEDDSDIINISVDDNYYFYQLMTVGYSKAIEWKMTTNKPGKLPDDVHLAEGNPDGAGSKGAAERGGGAQSFTDLVQAVLGNHQDGAKPIKFFPTDRSHNFAGDLSVNLGDSLASLFNVATITTLPRFDISRTNHIGSTVQVEGKDVRFKGFAEPGTTPGFVGKYTVLGFTHRISARASNSEFILSKIS